jgi:hypothetical protein
VGEVAPDVHPKYGDICRHSHFHVGIALDFDGDIWNRVDGGQGGSKAGRDVIKRIRGTQAYDSTKLQGWVDIELFFESAAQTTTQVPDWLAGWWKVMWRGQAYYYYFDRNHHVKWTQLVPKAVSQPPSVVRDTGNVAVDSNALTVRWGATRTVEKFNRIGMKNEMRGTWNDVEPLTAARM